MKAVVSSEVGSLEVLALGRLLERVEPMPEVEWRWWILAIEALRSRPEAFLAVKKVVQDAVDGRLKTFSCQPAPEMRGHRLLQRETDTVLRRWGVKLPSQPEGINRMYKKQQGGA